MTRGLRSVALTAACSAAVLFPAPVHINAEFASQTSDHDPLLADFAITGG